MFGFAILVLIMASASEIPRHLTGFRFLENL